MDSFSLFVRKTLSTKGFPYTPLKTRVEKRAAFFLMTEQQKYFIMQVRTAKKKTMNCMHCCAIFANSRQQVILHRPLMDLLRVPRTTKSSGVCICH